MSTDPNLRWDMVEQSWFLRPGILLALVLTLLLPVAGVFILGNPQWNKWIYIVQCYYLDRGQYPHHYTTERYLHPPENFTGVYYLWHPNGSLNGVMQVNQGEARGFTSFWRICENHDNTTLNTVVWRDGKCVSYWEDNQWHRNGNYPQTEEEFSRLFTEIEKAKQEPQIEENAIPQLYFEFR